MAGCVRRCVILVNGRRDYTGTAVSERRILPRVFLRQDFKLFMLCLICDQVLFLEKLHESPPFHSFERDFPMARRVPRFYVLWSLAV